MEEEPNPGCLQPGGSAKSTDKKLPEDLTQSETLLNPTPSQTSGSKEEHGVDYDKAGIDEGPTVTKGTNSVAGEVNAAAVPEQKIEASPQKESKEQGEQVSEDAEILGDLKYDQKEQLGDEVKPGYCGPDGDQKALKATLTNEATSSSVDGKTLRDGDLSKGDNDESQGSSTGDSLKNEKSTGECLSPRVSTESKKVPCSLNIDKKIDNQADVRQGDAKGEPSDDERPVGTTYGGPCQSAPSGELRTSLMSQEEPPKEELEKRKSKIRKGREDVETIGPTPAQAVLSQETGILGGGRGLWIAVAVVALLAIFAQYLLQSKSPTPKKDLRQVDVFLMEMEKVKTRYPNQRAELWSRNEIHLKRHLQTSQPTEPVSLILTSGRRAERTMRCLAQDVASSFSAAHNASVLQIDGASQAGQDSDQVKLDIDRKLMGAFEGDKPVAVIHRLEELPPGSTLIFYRYCDHENAAYKKTFLIFTVLLGDEEEIPTGMSLSVVEEMVDDYLQRRFLSQSHPASFDRMDLNKYGGLWSRISHLILPVAAEERIERYGC